VAIGSINVTLSAAPLEKLSASGEWTRFIASAPELARWCYRAAPVMRCSRMSGVILSFSREDRPHPQAEQTLLESWAQFASLAVERRGLYEQLSFRAEYDALTNLLNRASLYERLDKCIRANSVDRNPMSVVYLDLDSFKEINDGYGHDAGDKVLQHVSERILKSVRCTDIVARIGGDEFVVVLPGVGDRSEADRIAEKIAAAIAVPVAYNGQELRIGTCCGTSLYPVDACDTDALLRVADQNMYRIKLKHRARRTLQNQGLDKKAG
jgi:diguanylate cyclase (GGDEF)-like protein